MSVGYTDGELLNYLRTLKDPQISVGILVSGFGGHHQSHTKFLKGLVKQGKLVFTPNSRWGGTYSLPERSS